jgi:hypothetical protein
MSLEKLLQQKKSVILERWFDSILETYPTDTRRFLQKKKNRFANPVAHEISRGIEEIFNNILKGANSEDVSPFLDKIIRIRAVQDLSPSQALGFMFDLKKLIREEVAENMGESRISEDVWELEHQVPGEALRAEGERGQKQSWKVNRTSKHDGRDPRERGRFRSVRY